MKGKYVTVVIPCFKQAHWVTHAVGSCLDQTYEAMEIIVVDDGSPDDVPAALKPFGSSVRLIRQANKGLAAARNTGLAEACGEFVKFLDSDDWLLPHCVEQQVKVLAGLRRHIAVTGYRFHFDEMDRPDEDIYPAFGDFAQALCFVNTGPPHTFLYRTEHVRFYCGFQGKEALHGHEDYDLVCRMAADGFKTVVTHSIGCVYRQTPGSMSRNKDRMRASRVYAWIRYANQLLQGSCRPDLLVSLCGGYRLRVSTGDFRYEACDVLVSICERLCRGVEDLSVRSCMAVYEHCSRILIELPRPTNQTERATKSVCVRSITGLIEATVQARPVGRIVAPEQQLSLTNSAVSIVLAGKPRLAWRLLSLAESVADTAVPVRMGWILLRMLAALLPGRVAASVWSALRAFFGIFLR
ncbi:MAG: glycosyltransferase [Pseudomonadota bacterium]